MRCHLALPVLSLFLVPPVAGVAQEGAASDSPLVMHRVQAGTADERGWYDARSTEGKFRVRMPIPFNDFTVRGTKDEPPAWIIGAKSSEGFKFAATRMPRAVKDPGAELDRFSKSNFGTAKAVSVRRLDYHGHPAVELEIAGEQASAFMREIVLKDGVLLLAVEYPTARKADVAPLVPTFFDSLEVN